MAKKLTEWRGSEETPWLKEAPCHSLQHALKDLEKAYKNFFAKRAAFPRFKKRGDSSGFRYPDSQQIKLDQGNSRVFLPKLGWLRYRNCGYKNNADVVGAMNILERGHRLLACGEMAFSSRSKKQEPTEVKSANF